MKTRTAKPWLYSMINDICNPAINSHDITSIREAIAFCQGMILALGGRPESVRMYKYLQKRQASLYDRWRAIIHK